MIGSVVAGNEGVPSITAIGGTTVVSAGWVEAAPVPATDDGASAAAAAWGLPLDAVETPIVPLEPPPPQAERVNVRARREGKAKRCNWNSMDGWNAPPACLQWRNDEGAMVSTLFFVL
jgi:hypothetical protein